MWRYTCNAVAAPYTGRMDFVAPGRCKGHHLQKTPFALNQALKHSMNVCPEPVLVNRFFLSNTMAQKSREFRTVARQPSRPRLRRRRGVDHSVQWIRLGRVGHDVKQQRSVNWVPAPRKDTARHE